MRSLALLAGAAVAIGLFATPSVTYAQSSAAEMLEQARTRARDMEELKKVLNGPDQNMRLASFDIMVNSGDNAMREIAIDLGLASTDSLMQAMAFKEAIMGLESIVMNIEVDSSQPKEIQENAEKFLSSKGNVYTVYITGRDKAAGTFEIKRNKGQVSGTSVNFTEGYNSGTLQLVDETTMRGSVRVYESGYGMVIATARYR